MFRVGYPERRVTYPPYPRERETLQSTCRTSKPTPAPAKPTPPPRPVAEFWQACDALKAKQK